MKIKNNVFQEAFGLIQKLLGSCQFILDPKQNVGFGEFGIIFLQGKLIHIIFFMNYGFSNENPFIEIDAEEERERYPAQLYHHTANQENISEKSP